MIMSGRDDFESVNRGAVPLGCVLGDSQRVAPAAGAPAAGWPGMERPASSAWVVLFRGETMVGRSVGVWCLLVVCHLFGLSAGLPAADPVDADWLLKGALIHDGSGSDPIPGDIAIRGDRIVGVGQFDLGKVARVIDCQGAVVAPGFIDLHNHSDRQIVDPATRANINYVIQGCTTIVTGNCGSGPVAVKEYYDQIDAAGAGTNVAHLLPQGSLRREALGTLQRDATTAEMRQMQAAVERGMQQGAWGMSTGLIYVPSSYADTAELTELAKVVGRFGGLYVSHIRNENTELLSAVQEAMQIGKTAEVPVHISHFKSSGRESWGLVRRAAQMISQARSAGRQVTADQYPYIASSTSLDASLIPTWARAGGRQALIKRLDDPQQRQRIQSAMQDALERRNGGRAIRIARYSPRGDWVGKSLSQIAEQEQRELLDVALEITRSGGAAIVNFSMSEEDVRHVMQVDWVATASDGRAYLPGADRPHPRNYGTFARKIGHYAVRERVLALQRAIRSASGLPAEILGIEDRGLLRVGHFADVIVFRPEQVVDTATFDAPHQYARGFEYVFVNGRPAVFASSATGALAGRALRRTVSKDTDE